MAVYVTFPGTLDDYCSTDDVNLLDSDTAHLLQSAGLWTAGVISSSQAYFGSTSLQVAGGVSTAITPVTDAASFSVWVWSGSLETFDINGGTAVQVPSGVWTQLTAPGNAGTYSINTAGATTYYVDAACLQATGTGFVPSIRVVGDIEIHLDTALVSYQPTERNTGLSSWRSSVGGYELIWQRASDGQSNRPRFLCTVGGVNQIALGASAEPSLTDGTRHSWGVTREASSGDVDLFLDGAQLGTTLSSSVGALDVTAGTLHFGRRTNAEAPLGGNAWYGFVRDGIGGPDVAVFSPAQIPVGVGLTIPNGTTWQDVTGRTWTANGTGLVMGSDGAGGAARIGAGFPVRRYPLSAATKMIGPRV